jgi:hypothetical protein
MTGAPQRDRMVLVGDKSPKSKDRAKKQDAQNKNQKQADARAKATTATVNPGKKKG